jgi:hypothetical protein
VPGPAAVSGIANWPLAPASSLDTGDRSRLFVALDNVEGQAGDYTVDLSPTGPVGPGPDRARSSRAVPGPAAVSGIANWPLAPASSRSQSFALGISPGTGALLRRSVRSLAPGAGLTLTSET